MENLLEFKNSKPFTVGAELEIFLSDVNSFYPSNSSAVVYNSIPEHIKPYVQKELLQFMIEIITPVCSSPEEIRENFKAILKPLKEIAEKNGFFYYASGTHPYAYHKKVAITEDERYKRFLEEFQIVLKHFIICGLHIHVGFPDKEMAVKAYNMTINYLPLFLALSTSSPFFDKEFTGLHSYRTKVFEQLPRAGIPEYFENYNQFSELIMRLKQDKVINSINDVWWDIRIQPKFGTIELRICDSINDLRRIELITVLFQALCLYSQDAYHDKMFYQIIKQNKWNAVRHSINGDFLFKYGKISIRNALMDLVHILEKRGIFKELKTQSEVKYLKDLILRETISSRMIKEFKKSRSYKKAMKYGVLD
ncbi:MAG: YbdK family carboxylate-amine ligase [Aquificae bacterium]|nr:YbdK family carboxylate-amine ligase [Aquificota bacterium]